MKKLIFLVVLSIMMTTQHIPPVYAAGNIYYVDVKSGSDSNSGNIDNPFATLLKASQVMKPGDTCYIREGIYRETLYASVRASEDKSVTYAAYENEEVVISGGDVVTGWEQYEADIYKAYVPWNIDGGNMVFADGVMCDEARWPNKSNSLLDVSSYARAESVTGSGSYTLAHSEIPDIDYTGAMLWFNTETAYWSRIESVTSGEAGQLSFNTNAVSTSAPAADSIFYVTRALGLLDTEYEWYKDTSSNTLYLWTPDGVDPDTISVEVKKREAAIDLSNASYVNIKSINVRGAGVVTNDKTTHCTFDDMVFESMDYDLKRNSNSCAADGIKIYGTYNTVKNSEVKNNYGDGIELYGSNNAVLNCYIHDINYEHTYSDGIRISGTNQLVRGNTIHSTGRAAIGGSFTASDISYNDLSDTMKLSKDGGIIYLVNHDYKGSEIHHNYIHDNSGVLGGYQSGIYYDNSCYGIITYNNVLWNVEGNNSRARFLTINTPSNNNLFFNNTFINNSAIEYYHNAGSLTGVVFMNNIFKTVPFTDGVCEEKDVVFENNIILDVTELNSDYTLPSSSPAIDAGKRVPDIAEDYVGVAPDLGAYEYGDEVWSVGCDTEVSTEQIVHYNIPGFNVLKNRQFENDFENWKIESGKPQITEQNSWGFSQLITRQGIKAAKLNTGDSISQKITGLKPNTVYNVNVFAQIKGQFYSTDDVTEKSEGLTTSNYKASGIIANISDGAWIKFSDVDFGNGEFDKIAFLVNSLKKGDTLSVKLDSLDAENAAEFVMGYNDADGYWYEKHTSLASCTGVHDVYMVFSGTHSVSFVGGFVLDDSDSIDAVKITAVSDRADYAECNVTDTKWNAIPSSISVTTGDIGEIEMAIEKSSGNNAVYLDSLAITESFGETLKSSEVMVSNVKITDKCNNILSLFDGQEANIVEFDIINASDAEKTVTVESYSKNGALFGSSSIKCAVGEKHFALGIRVPNEHGQYILLKAGDEIMHKITLVDLGNQVHDDGEVYIKKLWINNSKLQQNISSNENNYITILVKNDSTIDKAGRMILALYDTNNMFTGAIQKDVILDALTSTRIETDDVIIPESVAYGKLFMWEGDTMYPLTNVFLFD